MLSILCALLVISILAFVHELGHFYVAKKFGFGIVEFAIGMGPVIFKKEKDGIQYSLRAFPIGGMCRFEGEDEECDSPRAFNRQPVGKRILVTLAGPVMNVLFALLFAVITLLAYGDYMPQVIGFASAEAPAVRGGMEENDILLNVGGTKITYYTEATDAILNADSENCTVMVDRNGERLSFTLHDIYDAKEGRNMLGVTIQPARYRFSLGECVLNSFRYVGDMIRSMFSFFGDLFKGRVQDGDVGGPVMMIDIIGQAVRLGFETALRLTVLISINLAVVNILPLPALDGGRIVLMLVEALSGKPINRNTEGMIHLIGFGLLMLLVVFLTYNDVLRLLQ